MPVKSKGKSDAALSGDPEAFTMSVGDIRAIFELMKSNDIGEIELEQGGTRIHVVSKQAVPTFAAPMHYVAAAPTAAEPHTAPPPATGGPVSSASGVSEESAPSNVKTVKSPMVGTFYRAPAPDSDPFVRAGDQVTEDTVLCIIEAMKLFNEIKADCRGRIYKVLVENGQPVEYNQPLFLVEPD